MPDIGKSHSTGNRRYVIKDEAGNAMPPNGRASQGEDGAIPAALHAATEF